jgi:transcriptional regulator with XRE-family HTH domain
MKSPLRKERDRRKLTLEDVAEAVGVSGATVSRIENGECGAGREVAKRLLKFFKPALTLEEILYPEDFIDASARKPAHQAAEPLQAAS